MNINFPPVDEKFIKSKIENGYYSNATELVRDAVRRLREKDASLTSDNSAIHDAWFREEVVKGIAQADEPDAIWLGHEEVKAKISSKKAELLSSLNVEAA
ncbi:MAG: hypothetical protein FD163_1196 [Hyphomonadaceae bacterium]|nr:MAG: hypothetical protein FD128_2303 [Hyphomonadaceae bacterium]KAF0185381.1 MAG: hypothetical protein FD163_1196 [Hyphomonadaceae bacterium]